MKDKLTRPHYQGVMFYSANDLSIKLNLQKSEEVITNFDNNATFNINKILELCNIVELFQLHIRLPEWNNTYYQQLNDKVETFKSIIGRFLSTIDDEKFITIYLDVSVYYINSFWNAFEQYALYKKISSETIKKYLLVGDVKLSYLLQHKKIVAAYDALLTVYMITEHKGAELIIKQHLVKNNEDSSIYYFPQGLTPQNKVDLIESFINSSDPNPNYLNVITKGKCSSELPITDEVRLSAKEKYDNFWRIHFASHQGLKYKPIIIFKDIESEVEIDLSDAESPVFTYSNKWISDNSDYPTLLNNFIYLFEFVDGHYCSTFPAKHASISVFEDAIGLKSKNAYYGGIGFDLYDMISLLQMRGYHMQLLRNNIYLEDVFKWFFETYLVEEFNVTGFTFNPPSIDCSFLEKFRLLSPELDSVLKQFDMYVRNGCINRELLEISSSAPKFSQIHSFNSKKYGYVNDHSLRNFASFLFSNQSFLSYTEKTQNKHDTLATLLVKEKVKISDFHHYQIPYLNALLDNNIINAEDGYLKIVPEMYILLSSFYNHDVLCTTYYQSSILNELTSEDKIILEGTLFSRPEQDYLDYMLNDRTFDNGLKLRNKYTHASNSSDPTKHENDYYQLLKVFTLVVLKINEEFCRRDDLWT